MHILSTTRNQVGESPLWSVAEQALYWVDIEARRLHRFDWISRVEQTWDLAERLACIALHADGGLIAGMESGIFHLRPGANGVCAQERIHGVQFVRQGMRFNDGRCDRAGRFWVTSMVMDMRLKADDGALYSMSPTGFSAPLVSNLVTGNGLAFSPDGRTMYFSDSHPSVQKIWAMDLDSNGVPSNRRLFVDMLSYPGRPDGAAVDAEGAYWICGNDAGQIHRFMPDGRLDKTIKVPVSKPSMCSFGGPELAHLFITSITPAQPAEGVDAALDGAVFVMQPGVRGLPETPFHP
ncbi:SMP-30/gluconolactonase/LRE family protein [Herbaspirillum sp. RTI4]|uniref:SMP-30/gluconolactonase/LRE family protein n=1 Tax=Herbaspirillum sp. RTI4 TaxID=3048640 RepID=UPI002AB52B15|nr:SMP-30/gluconolactonase/LRE family protein [Herbaspirillum sp. RTI4]MDY7577106.1 SMP-30/gluconolactonase/LRE family protein [Herbaspirillum sp. RTI4]MEA9982848.1 SMP-30/gluconolactonase/LRE family protein [Herbaspirillum sp. RTI4]